MATYDKLDWGKKSKLQNFYEQLNPKPSDLQFLEEPKSEPSKLVRADGESRVFVEMPNERRRAGEAMVRLTLQIGNQAQHVEIVEEEAVLLFNELTRVIADVRKVNEVRRNNLAAEKALKDSQTNWEKQRESFLREAIRKHRITWEMIDDAESPEDLPCFKDNGSA